MNRNVRKLLFRGLALAAFIIAIGSCSVVVSLPSYLRISNTSAYWTLAHVYITPHSSTVWGNDRLAPDVITPGNSARWTADAGFYDVLVTDTTPYSAYAFDVGVTAGETTTLYFDGTSLAP